MDAQLAGLQMVLKEVMDGRTANARKREIEASLAQFKQQDGAWQMCKAFVEHSVDLNVLWYSTSVFEYIVNFRWEAMSQTDKSHVREFLYNCCKQDLPPFVLNKIYKIYADVGKKDWPHDFHSFFDSVTGLLGDGKSPETGLRMLRVTLEELVSRQGVPAKRGDELVRMVTAQVPPLLAHLSGMLDTMYENAVRDAKRLASDNRLPTVLGVPSTPRSSPTQFCEAPPPQTGRQASGDLDIEAFLKFGDGDMKRVSLILECICQLFSWINLSQTVSPALLNTIFAFAQLTDPSNAAIGSLALSCFNEMLVHNCVPANFQEYLLKLFQHTMQLLVKVTTAKDADQNPMADIADDYNSRLTEFLSLFVTAHLRRVEQNPLFPVKDFLMLLFRFTFLQPETDGFVHCLEVCRAFVDVLLAAQETAGPAAAEAYRECLVLLTSELVGKLRFSRNGRALMAFDNETRNDASLTEWDEHVVTCTEIMFEVAMLFPLDVIKTVYPAFAGDLQTYVHVHECVGGNGGARQLVFPTKAAEETVYVVCRDLSTMIKVIGKTSHFYAQAEAFSAYLHESLELVKNLVAVLKYTEQHRLYDVSALFVSIQAEALSTLRIFAPWFVRGLHDNLPPVRELLDDVLACTVALLKHPPDAALAVLQEVAADLLSTVAARVRPPYLLTSPLFADLVSHAPRLCEALTTDTRAKLTVAITHVFLLPWFDVSDAQQDWENRQASFSRAFAAMFGQMCDTGSALGPWTLTSCTVLATLTRAMREHAKTTRAAYAKAIAPVLPVVLHLFQACAQAPGTVGDVLDLLLALFESLASLLDGTFVEEAISRFIAFFSAGQLRTLAAKGKDNDVVMARFFTLIQLLVQERSAAFRRFFGGVVAICIDAVGTVLAQDAAIEVQMALYDVLKHIMLDNWKFFYPSAMAAMRAAETPLENGAFFKAICDAFLTSFCKPELVIFKQNLEIVSVLNAQKKLFSKAVFKEQFWLPYLEAFVTVLANKTHALLEEEVCAVVYDLAAVDFPAFFSWGLPTYLSRVAALSDSHRADLHTRFGNMTDQPTFAASLKDMSRDLNFFLTQSGSNGAAAVQFA